MPRERPEYRVILESLLKFMENRGGGHVMTIKDAAEFIGKSPRTVARKYNISKEGITIEALAMRLSKL